MFSPNVFDAAVTDGLYSVVVTNKYGQSNALNFEVTSRAVGNEQAAITVISPKAGSTWLAGSVQNVQWTSNNIPSLTSVLIRLRNPATDIEYSLVDNTPNDGSESVNVPLLVPDGIYRLEIKASVAGNSVVGLSDNFNIVSVGPAVSCGSTELVSEDALDNPGGSGPFERLGLDITAHPEILKYRIQWFSGGWSDWYTPGTNDIDWKTNLDGTQRRVWSYFDDHYHQYLRCNDISPPAVVPKLQILSPNGGETFQTGGEMPIKWSAYAGPNYVDLNLLYNDNQILNIGRVPNNGSFNWLIPFSLQDSGGGFKVKISGDSAVDTSDAPFSIAIVSYSTSTPITPMPYY